MAITLTYIHSEHDADTFAMDADGAHVGTVRLVSRPWGDLDILADSAVQAWMVNRDRDEVYAAILAAA